MVPVLLIMAGGAMFAGGPVLAGLGQRRLAYEQASRLRAARLETLRDEVEVRDLRRQVREAGGDPDAAEAALQAILDGRLSIGDIQRHLGNQGL